MSSFRKCMDPRSNRSRHGPGGCGLGSGSSARKIIRMYASRADVEGAASRTWLPGAPPRAPKWKALRLPDERLCKRATHCNRGAPRLAHAPVGLPSRGRVVEKSTTSSHRARTSGARLSRGRRPPAIRSGGATNHRRPFLGSLGGAHRAGGLPADRPTNQLSGCSTAETEDSQPSVGAMQPAHHFWRGSTRRSVCA